MVIVNPAPMIQVSGEREGDPLSALFHPTTSCPCQSHTHIQSQRQAVRGVREGEGRHRGAVAEADSGLG